MSWTIGAVTAIISAYVAVRCVAADAQRPAVSRSDHAMLRTNRGLLGVGIVAGIGMPILFAAVARTIPPSTFLELLAFVVALSAFAIPGGLLVWRSVSRRYAFDPGGVTLTIWGRDSLRLRWDEVRRARFRGMPPALVLEGSQGEAIRISLQLGGVDELLSEMERRVPHEISGGAVADSRKFRAPM